MIETHTALLFFEDSVDFCSLERARIRQSPFDGRYMWAAFLCSVPTIFGTPEREYCVPVPLRPRLEHTTGTEHLPVFPTDFSF